MPKHRLWRLSRYGRSGGYRTERTNCQMGTRTKEKLWRLCNRQYLKLVMIVDRMSWRCNSFPHSEMCLTVLDWIYICFLIGLLLLHREYCSQFHEVKCSVALLMFYRIRSQGICWDENMLMDYTSTLCESTMVLTVPSSKKYYSVNHHLIVGSQQLYNEHGCLFNCYLSSSVQRSSQR